MNPLILLGIETSLKLAAFLIPKLKHRKPDSDHPAPSPSALDGFDYDAASAALSRFKGVTKPNGEPNA